MAESVNYEESTQEDLKSIKNFTEKAASHKTPFKPPKVKCNLKDFEPNDREKFLKTFRALKDSGFGKTPLEYFERVDNQFYLIQCSLENATSKMNHNVEEIFLTLKMLEFEKKKLKLEVGNCKDVTIEDVFDAASVWESVSLISHILNSKPAR